MLLPHVQAITAQRQRLQQRFKSWTGRADATYVHIQRSPSCVASSSSRPGHVALPSLASSTQPCEHTLSWVPHGVQTQHTRLQSSKLLPVGASRLGTTPCSFSAPLVRTGAVSPKGQGRKREWTKNKLEELRRRSPGPDKKSPAHHAKPGPNANMGDQKEKRRLVCFIGGLDMCDGRYDTPRHSLFHTLATVHTEDFHQACITGADIKKGGTPLPARCLL